MKKQETRTKSQDQSAEDIKDIKSHARMVENIVYAFRHLRADMLDHNLSYARNEGRQFIEGRFNYLETAPGVKEYIQTFGPFYRLYNSLKDRYENEVKNLTSKV